MPHARAAAAGDDPEKTQPVAIPAAISPSAKTAPLPVAAPPKLPPTEKPAGAAPRPKSGDDMIRLVKLGTLTFVIVLIVFTLLLFFFGR